ncbi:phosphoglucomutase/phosphomannomutase, alpha/beta/alpha domain protein [Rhizoctonia solani]|uniref:Phosphoglucomutase/phosphomannomutase, alpha/beta/alpha domain protein n=1 Tax=Rhizoctonia solani TaxID=456999 RepID=A0A8H8P3U8_9AGAM|nr:phosphoglucomutase/phosphomannomutase, alpha/beta/alpha domain protein [Rhizoctonia solani]QRW24153.1 phosphoglucomutase/phosphomannomutase, alpha/beta/alpha domain protein [Rhizoctonia solani]
MDSHSSQSQRVACIRQATRAEIESLRDAGNTEELKRRLMKRIEFGTAGKSIAASRVQSNRESEGLRGLMAAVSLASQGLCAYVLQNVPNATERGVVVGHDHRYNSEKWAQLTAAAFVSKGFKVYLYKGIVHTPLVPYTVSKLNAAAGVMITASHNPKDDNGYKVYWENAVQIISPHDAGIAAAIEANLRPLRGIYILSQCGQSIVPGKQMLQSSQVYQYIHAWSFSGIIDRANKVFDFKPLEHVKEQQDPNPDFPTVAFPNPEEKVHWYDLAIKTANASGSSYVFAQDPDSDRFAAAQKKRNVVRLFRGPAWKLFAGGYWGYKASGRPIEKLAMVASTVSSKLIGAMAAKEGFKFVESLTGFKYIGNAARARGRGIQCTLDMKKQSGSCLVKKFVIRTAFQQRRRKLATDYLEEIYAQYGYFQAIDQIFARLRSYNDPASLSKDKMSQYPKSIGGLTVTDIRDLTTGHGFDSSAPAPDYAPSLPVSGGHMITFKAKGDGIAIVLTVRTSGTEPKIKYYLEGSGSTREQVTKALARVVDELRDEWMQAKLHNLGIPGA